MQNEILKPVLDTDEVAVPRYDIVGPNGSVIQQNVELRLKNEVVQEGTPYDEESVLPASLREQLELPQSATPAEAMAAMLAKSGGAVRRNRPPLTTDADQVGKLWVVPEMFFNNLMPNALTQAAGNWQSSNAAVVVSGNTATFTGNGTESSVYVQVGMLAGAKAGDKVFVQATVKVNHDANAATIQLTCGEQTLATKTLNVPAAGDTMLLQAVATAEVGGALVLRLHSTYNTAAVQSGKSLTVSTITVWNLTEDMCEAQKSNEFTEAEAANYIKSFGQFQTKEYEYSTWWWVLRGSDNGQYLWHRMYDYASTSEAQAGTDDTKLMTALKVQQFLNAKIASQPEVQSGTADDKVVTPLKLQQKVNPILEDVNKLLSSFKFVKSAEFKTAGTHTWTPTAAQTLGIVVVVGAGGGGASGGQGGSVCGGGGGGGGGEVIISAIMTFAPGTPINIVVGAGGKGGASGYTSAGGYAGTAGGSTSVLGMVAEGGKGGSAPSTWNGGNGGAGGGTNGAAGGRGGGTKSDIPAQAGASGGEIIPVSPFGNLSAGGGGGKSTSTGDTTVNGPLGGGTSSIGNGGAGSATTGTNGGNGAGGGGGGSRDGASGYGGGKGGDGYVAIYTMGVS